MSSLGKFEPKMSSYLPNYPSHTLQAQKNLFDSKGCVLSTLVENNMTNKVMRLKLL